MKRVLLGFAIAGVAAFAAPHATAAVEYCDATFRPSCEQCLPDAVNYTGQPICVWIGPVSGS
jgi:hypothetical protein